MVPAGPKNVQVPAATVWPHGCYATRAGTARMGMCQHSDTPVSQHVKSDVPVHLADRVFGAHREALRQRELVGTRKARPECRRYSLRLLGEWPRSYVMVGLLELPTC